MGVTFTPVSGDPFAQPVARSCGADATRPAQRLERTARLAGWISKPYMQAPVIAALKAAHGPLTLSEIADAANVPLRPANRVLARLVKKRLAVRYKVAIQRHAFCRKRWKCIPHAARRMLYVYKWAGDAGRRGQT